MTTRTRPFILIRSRCKNSKSKMAAICTFVSSFFISTVRHYYYPVTVATTATSSGKVRCLHQPRNRIMMKCGYNRMLQQQQQQPRYVMSSISFMSSSSSSSSLPKSLYTPSSAAAFVSLLSLSPSQTSLSNNNNNKNVDYGIMSTIRNNNKPQLIQQHRYQKQPQQHQRNRHSYTTRNCRSFHILESTPTSTGVSITTNGDDAYSFTTSSLSSQTTPSKTTPTSTTSSSSLPPVPNHAHRIVFMRHGESAFNNANIFTGWCDIALTQRGIVEAVEAGEVFRSHNITFRQCYTSLLTRSIITAHRSLEAAGISYVPIKYDWRLNERHYGALQGLSKDRIADQLGTKRVMAWRRSYTAKPPIMTTHHPHYSIIQEDIRYQHVKHLIPNTESLQDCQLRVIEAWEDLVNELQSSSSSTFLESSPNTLIVAHANSLRALVMHLDNIPEHDIESLNIPTGIPFYYDIDLRTGNVVLNNNTDHKEDDTKLSSSIPTKTKEMATKKKSEQKLPLNHNQFRGVYISDERKKHNFLERRRAANDPWLWALHDDQVSRRMLLSSSSSSSSMEYPQDMIDDTSTPNENDNHDFDYNDVTITTTRNVTDDSLLNNDGINEEAARNTELFASTSSSSSTTPS